MIRQFRQHFGRVRYTVVEPGNVIENFKQRAKESRDLENVQFTWKNMTYDEFCREEINNEKKYAFIGMIHSVYYMDDLTKTLAKLVGSLTRGGALLIMSNSGM